MAFNRCHATTADQVKLFSEACHSVQSCVQDFSLESGAAEAHMPYQPHTASPAVQPRCKAAVHQTHTPSDAKHHWLHDANLIHPQAATHMATDRANHPAQRKAHALHAGHAGLLRLKRQWRPISRLLRQSDSDSDDSSDSLSEFDSIADFSLATLSDQDSLQHSQILHRDISHGNIGHGGSGHDGQEHSKSMNQIAVACAADSAMGLRQQKDASPKMGLTQHAASAPYDAGRP